MYQLAYKGSTNLVLNNLYVFCTLYVVRFCTLYVVRCTLYVVRCTSLVRRLPHTCLRRKYKFSTKLFVGSMATKRYKQFRSPHTCLRRTYKFSTKLFCILNIRMTRRPKDPSFGNHCLKSHFSFNGFLLFLVCDPPPGVSWLT